MFSRPVTFSHMLSVFLLLWLPSLQWQVWGPACAILCLLVRSVAQRLSSRHPGHSALPQELRTLTINPGLPRHLFLFSLPSFPPPHCSTSLHVFLGFVWVVCLFFSFSCVLICTLPLPRPFTSHLTTCQRVSDVSSSSHRVGWYLKIWT